MRAHILHVFKGTDSTFGYTPDFFRKFVKGIPEIKYPKQPSSFEVVTREIAASPDNQIQVNLITLLFSDNSLPEVSERFGVYIEAEPGQTEDDVGNPGVLQFSGYIAGDLINKAHGVYSLAEGEEWPAARADIKTYRVKDHTYVAFDNEGSNIDMYFAAWFGVRDPSNDESWQEENTDRALH